MTAHRTTAAEATSLQLNDLQHELANLASLDASQLRVRNARLEIAELLSLKCPGCRPSTGFSVPPPRS